MVNKNGDAAPLKLVLHQGHCFVGEPVQADEALQPNSQLEINLVLPAEIAGLSETEVVCRGEVVRTVEAQGSTLTPALAARILQYHFQHGPLPRA